MMSDFSKYTEGRTVANFLTYFKFRKKRDCAIHVAKTKALISCTVTVQLICASVTPQLIWTFVFAYTKSRFSHEAAHICGDYT